MKYETTKIQCQKRIDELNNICDYCGRKIVPMKTTDNAGSPTYWAGCQHGGDSGHFTCGVPKEIFKLARKLVLNGEIYYDDDNKSDYNKNKDLKLYWIESQTSGFARFIQKINYLKNNKPRKTLTEFIKSEF